MPYITNMAAAGVTFRLLLQQRDGLVNIMLNNFGLPSIPWLETPFGAQVSISLLILWAWLGYNMVLMLSGLQTIPNDLGESAMIDGANRFEVFWYITIPLMRPMITFSLVLSTIGSFGLFTEVFTLTGGGPMNATVTPIIRIFTQAFTNLRFGYASATAYVYFAFIFVVTLVQLKYMNRAESEEE
jgi:ABC-type sugar transport system permease subunit